MRHGGLGAAHGHQKMNFVTVCPACATCFRIQSQQLAARQGKVRCGKCGEAFDALERLAEEHEELPTDITAEAQTTEPEEKLGAYTYTLVDKTLDSELESSPASEVDIAPTVILQPAVATPRHWPVPVLLMALILLACLQTLFYLRTPIAARWPAVKPYLVAACDTFGCKVPLPAQPDLLAIDDSDLQEDAEYQGLLRFSSVIINKADFTQAYPLLELTLTDGADQPVLRRTFSPKEYLPSETNIAAGLAAADEIRIKLALSVDEVSIAGYRAFVTYAKAPT